MDTAPDADEIAEMQAEVALFLPDRATLQSKQPTPDAFGKQTLAYSPVATQVPCRMAPTETKEVVQPDGSLAFVTLGRITFSATTTVLDGYRILVAGRTFEVIGTPNAEAWSFDNGVAVKEVSTT